MRRFDVAIAGAGPAGVALALRLRRLGHDVVLFTAPSPAAHGFETLNPAAQAQLAFEGLTPEAGAVCRCETRWDEARFAARQTYLLVDRRQFHRGLEARARDTGVTVIAARAQAAAPVNDGWRIEAGGGAFYARFFADATGRVGLSGRAQRRGPPLIGLHSIWSCERAPGAIRIAAAPDAWVWGAPTPDGRYAVSVFEDPRQGRHNGDLASRTLRAVSQSQLFEGAGEVRLDGGVCARDATPSRRTAVKGPLFRLGDAATTLDPLSSAGIQSALQSAVDAAMAIHTQARDPGAAGLVAEFLERRLTRRALHHAAYAASFYAAAAPRFSSPFWALRAAGAAKPPEPVAPPAPGQAVALNAEALLTEEPCLLADGVARRRAVTAPGLGAPVAFVAGVDLAPLLEKLPPEATPENILRAWSAQVGTARAQRVIAWAWRTGVLAAAPSARKRRDPELATPQNEFEGGSDDQIC